LIKVPFFTDANTEKHLTTSGVTTKFYVVLIVGIVGWVLLFSTLCILVRKRSKE